MVLHQAQQTPHRPAHRRTVGNPGQRMVRRTGGVIRAGRCFAAPSGRGSSSTGANRSPYFATRSSATAIVTARAQPLLRALAAVAEAHGASPPQAALAWTIRHACVVAIPGASSIEQLGANAATAGPELGQDEVAALGAASRAYAAGRPAQVRRIAGLSRDDLERRSPRHGRRGSARRRRAAGRLRRDPLDVDGPASASERLPNVPSSHGQRLVSPITSRTLSSGTSSSYATSSESAVRLSWPTSTFP